MRATYKYGEALLIQKTFNTYKNGDVIYFEYPVKDSLLNRTYFIQRICGCPGDSVKIVDHKVLINGMDLPPPPTVKYNYYFKTLNYRPDSLFRARYQLIEGGPISDEHDFSYSLTKAQYEMLRLDPHVEMVENKTEKKGAYDENCYPGSPEYPWNKDNYGGIYVPKINDTLQLDSMTVKLYGSLIEHHEKNSLQMKADSIFINDELTNTYVVKKNYYFVLGDNRDNAVDSRTWGFLPENCIKGKVLHSIHASK